MRRRNITWVWLLGAAFMVGCGKQVPASAPGKAGVCAKAAALMSAAAIVVNIFFSIGENSINSFKFSLQFRVNSL